MPILREFSFYYCDQTTIFQSRNQSINQVFLSLFSIIPLAVAGCLRWLLPFALCVGWIAPVSGDVYKARCLYCHIIVRAHYKDLKVHARTAKHAHNVAVNQPGFIADPSSPAAKPLLNRRRAFGPQRTTRFGWYCPFPVVVFLILLLRKFIVPGLQIDTMTTYYSDRAHINLPFSS